MAEMAHFYLTHDSKYDIVAFTADKDHIHNDTFMGLPLLPFESITKLFPPTTHKMFVAVGYDKLNSTRATKYKEAKEKGYTLISYISSKAIHWGDVKVGGNCFILENQVIQPNVKIGNNVILWSGSHFGHDVVIEDHCWVSSQVVLSGNVSVGERSFIGVNATIRDKVSIGKECIIGAGTLILSSTADKSVYVAKPSELYPVNSTDFLKIMGFAIKKHGEEYD